MVRPVGALAHPPVESAPQMSHSVLLASGRDSTHQRRSTALPAGIQMVILFTDFLGHNVMQRFREAANREGVAFVCCRRSVCALQQALGKRVEAEQCASCGAGCEPRDKKRRGR